MREGVPQESLQMYKDLFDNAHDLIHFLNLDGTVIYINNSWSHTLGYSLEEVQGKSIYFLIPEEEREMFLHYRQQVIEGAIDKKNIVLSLQAKDGQTVIVEGFITATQREGAPAYTTGIFRDITDKVRSEEQLREREYNLQQLVAYAPDAIIVIDSSSHIVFWNPKAEEIFGWTAKEVIGQVLTNIIIPPEYREAHEHGMKRYLSTGEAHVLNRTVDLTALHKKGHTFYVSLTISTARLAGQQAFVSFIRDITAQKRAVLELEQQRKALEETNQELEQFAYAASHDMQEPLRKIRTYASYLLEAERDHLTQRGKEYLERIDASAGRMRSLIDALLNYSAHTGTHRTYELVDLNTVLKHVCADLALQIEQTGARIQSDSLPVIEAVRVQMDQLLYNLINNALKFSRPGTPPEVRISARHLHRENSPQLAYIELAVTDNGIGFEQENSEKIFGLFQRLNDPRSFEGTGIGLTLAKKIVANHNGDIHVQSAPGQGTTFFITLPVHAKR